MPCVFGLSKFQKMVYGFLQLINVKMIALQRKKSPFRLKKTNQLCVKNQMDKNDFKAFKNRILVKCNY